MREQIKKLVEKSVKSDVKVLIDIPRDKKHGDYSTNAALLIAKKTGEKPMDIAHKIVQSIPEHKNIEKIEAIEPGFINFFLSDYFFQKELNLTLKKKKRYGSDKANKTLVIDYSSPNIAKTFGVGHLRSTIIGQAIYNIYQFLGWKCIGDNHLGDWGTQFGKLIYQIKEQKLKNKTLKERKEILKNLTISDLEELYIDFHKKAQEDNNLEEEARKWFKRLELKDPEAQEIWKICKKISLLEFERIYNILGIKIDYVLGESFYLDLSLRIIKEAEKEKIAEISRGALIVELDPLPPAMLLKSDKATTYLARDLATIKYRAKKWKPNLIVYEVGADQSLYLKQLFAVAQKFSWAQKIEFFHVAHGLVRWKHGKFSTRKGETIHLEDVFKEAFLKAEELIKEKTDKKIAQIIAIGAIKYNDLSQHYSRDIIFDWDKIINLKGNSGPYLQYTAVRCKSVLRKEKHNTPKRVDFSKINEEEKDLLRTISKFPDVVKISAESFSPHLICNFIFDLAQKYNLFYEKYPILSATYEKQLRLSLTKAVLQILENSLKLLGIEIPEKM